MNILIEFLKEYFEAIIAFIALVLSLWTIIATRRHNRLSVRPQLLINVHQGIEGVNDYEVDTIYCDLVNHGLGPAILYKQLRFSYKDQRYDTIMNVLEAEFLDFSEIVCIDECIGDSYEKLILPSAARISVLAIPVIDTSKIESIKKVLWDIRFKLEYKDMYNKTFIARM